MSKPMARWMLLLVIAGAVAGCGDTWSGVKQDTKDNIEATGNAVEETGEKIEDSVQ